jgi:glycosyltransferase involved in cell wall biosynthesis
MRIAIIGPVYPYRAGIAYCTTRLAEELAKTADVEIVSFSRQYPKRFYPGGDDVDETLRSKTPAGARFVLDVINPLTWLRTGLALRRSAPDAVILVWWIWVWALPYLTILWLLRKRTRVLLQCHNIGDKEPAAWKRWLTNRVLRRGDALVVHAKTEAEDAKRRLAGDPRQRVIVTSFLPVHELGGAIPDRLAARTALGITADRNVALFFGHVRPFKGLDLVLRAWPDIEQDVLLIVGGEAWWKGEQEYRELARSAGLRVVDRRDREVIGASAQVAFDFRFIPDSEIATWFAAADVVLAPYRIEAQSGVALTAFHFARPVIATTVGGLPEVIDEGRNGMLIPPEDPPAIARAVDSFFKRDDRDAMEAAAAESAARYSWPEYSAVFIRLLDRTKC